MHDPPVLFLDEPSAPGSILRPGFSCGKSFANTTRRDAAVLLTTHNMEEADGLCQRLAIIDHGHVIALGTSVD